MTRNRMYSEVRTVTPDQATTWLEGNTHNRPIRQQRIEQYALDMKEGRWYLTHQGIAFSKKPGEAGNRLLDGQHRLWAIVESGCSIEMTVWYYVPEEAQGYIDEGLPRKAVDVLKLSDESTRATAYRMAVARRMLVGTRTQVITTRAELIEFYTSHEKAITYTVDEVFQGKKVVRVMPASVGAVVARAYYAQGIDKDRLKEFGKIMLDGMAVRGEADAAAILLRNWLLTGQKEWSRGMRLSHDVLVYMKAQRALVGFLGGEKLRGLYHMKDEAFPLPGEHRRRQTRRGPQVPGGKKDTSK